jgi:tetratricopeptide (TPR) repeat protein
LAAIQNLTLLITLRGSELPYGTAWTRPFVPPLAPLDHVAALSTFTAISDKPKEDVNISKLLKALDNWPLAITLMANLAQYETPKVLLERWEHESTPMLTQRADDRLSSLEISIKISLEGPRMLRHPTAMDLLCLLALLPHGPSQLQGVAPGIPHVAKAASVLKSVGLALTDGAGALRILAPVRGFIMKNYPPHPEGWKSMLKYYENLAAQCSSIERGMDGKAIVECVTPEVANLQAVLEHSLEIPDTDFPNVISAAVNLIYLLKYTGLGSTTTLEKAAVKAQAIGHNLLLAHCIWSQGELHYSRSNRTMAIAKFEKALKLYSELPGTFSEQGRCTMMIGMNHSSSGSYKEAIEAIGHAIELHQQGMDVIGEVSGTPYPFQVQPLTAVSFRRTVGSIWLKMPHGGMSTQLPSPTSTLPLKFTYPMDICVVKHVPSGLLV